MNPNIVVGILVTVLVVMVAVSVVMLSMTYHFSVLLSRLQYLEDTVSCIVKELKDHE